MRSLALRWWRGAVSRAAESVLTAPRPGIHRRAFGCQMLVRCRPLELAGEYLAAGDGIERSQAGCLPLQASMGRCGRKTFMRWWCVPSITH
eukprot:12930452-Alexandrium_andersonii.AAC.1